MSGEVGQTVLLNVGVELTLEPGLVLTLLQLLGAWIVLEAIQTLSHVTILLVQVNFNFDMRVTYTPDPTSLQIS